LPEAGDRRAKVPRKQCKKRRLGTSDNGIVRRRAEDMASNVETFPLGTVTVLQH